MKHAMKVSIANNEVVLYPIDPIMKQYVHPMNWMASHGFKTDFAEWYKISNWEWLLVFWDEWISEMVLLEFWFIEKEEEPDTDTKWIEDVYKDLNKYYDLTLDMLEDSILSHIPKQWKTQATHEI